MPLHLRPSSIESAGPAEFRQKPDGNIDPAGETGWFLQRERERVGKSLADAALETQINAKYLHAMEHGKLSELPAHSYVLGYVRVYAEFLGLDPDPLVDHYAALLRASDEMRRRGPSAMTMAAGLAACVAAAGFVWFALPVLTGGDQVAEVEGGSAPHTTLTVERTAPDTMQTGSVDRHTGNADPAADAIAEMLDQAVPTVRVRQEGFADDVVVPGPGSDGLQPGDMAPVVAPAPGSGDGLTEFIRQHVDEAVSPSVDTGPAVGPDGTTYGSENSDSRLILQANKSVWIRVEDSEGRIMITRTLQSGDSYRVPNRDGLVLIARDGGALDYSIDGTLHGAIGAPGEIVVGRPLDLGNLSSRDG